MTIRHLRIFASVAREGSVTRAAQALHLSQPAVSVAVRELEAHYGVRLFERMNQRLRITAEGTRFLSYAAHLLNLLDEMEKAFANPDGQGELRVGASVTVGTHDLPGLVLSLRERYPGLSVRVCVDTTDVLEGMLLRNDLDVAVAEGVAHSDLLTRVPLARDALCAVCAPGHPFAAREAVRLDELLAQPLLLRERHSGLNELFMNALSVRGFTARPAWESASVEALKAAARAGLGVAILPERLARADCAAGSLRAVAVEGFTVERTIALLRHKRKFVSPAMACFERLATAALGGGAGETLF